MSPRDRLNGERLLKERSISALRGEKPRSRLDSADFFERDRSEILGKEKLHASIGSRSASKGK